MIKKVFIITSLFITLAVQVGAVSISLDMYNVDDSSKVYNIQFGTIPATESYAPAQQYIKVDITEPGSAILWRLDIYTDNGAGVPGYQKGGIIHKLAPEVRMPMAWTTTNDVLVPPIAVGDPNDGLTGWMWIKDKGDTDIPVTESDESWDNSWEALYTAACWGDTSWEIYSRGNVMTSPLNIYFESQAQDTPAGEYEGTVWFDFFFITDMEPPLLEHTPIGDVVTEDNVVYNTAALSDAAISKSLNLNPGVRGIMRGNEIIFEATATDEREVRAMNLYYRVDGSTWQVKELSLVGTDVSKTTRYSFVPPLARMAVPGKSSPRLQYTRQIEYALSVTDGINTTWFRSKENPQVIEIKDTMVFPMLIQGQISVPDGNPYDGETSVKIPHGALASPLSISITSVDADELNEGSFGVYGSVKRPVVAYEFGPDGLVFSKPIDMVLLYSDHDNDGIVENPDGTPSNIDEKQMQICWWDGYVWRYIGGKVDTAANTVTIKTDHFSMYALFPISERTEDDYRPKEKIITPASIDSKNDSAEFTALNGLDYTINIFDITGRKVRVINSPQLPKWDGKDEFGTIVESGVYIYQFEAEVSGHMKLISGTIVVAK